MTSELQHEQAYVDRVYARVDRVLADVRATAAVGARAGAGHGASRNEDEEALGTFEARVALSAMVRASVRRAARLDEAGEGLVFGRLDRAEPDPVYVGRVGVSDEDRDPLVVDWRAPVAEPFYRATPSEPMGIVRRRHLLCRGRRVTSVFDELLDESAGELALVGEGALMASLVRSRSGRMRDIVQTIQAEQDAIVRAPLEGVLLVQGGPGTGKTAVALHRVAYLLYTHRDRLARDGVLVLGPSGIFLRYIEQVLPSLGEQSAVLTTPAELAFGGGGEPGEDPPEVERLKGDARMVEVMRRAVEDRERGLREPLKVLFDEEMLVITPAASKRLVAEARSLPGLHNAKRIAFVHLLTSALYWHYRREVAAGVRAGRRGRPVELGEAQTAFARAMLEDRGVRDAIDEMWPELTAERLVAEMLSSRERLRRAARGVLRPGEADLLVHEPDSPWTVGDAALVDEAAVVLGPARRARRKAEPVVADEELYFVERLLDDLTALGEYDRHREVDATALRDIGETIMRARIEMDEPDREPEPHERFGHVIVDEAQDLSPMQWRMVARRCPTGSMTLLGDLGQAGRAWCPDSWDEVTSMIRSLSAPGAPPAIGGRVQRPVDPRVVELTVNYRTPAEFAELAERVLAEAAPGVRPPRSVRRGDRRPLFVRSAAVAADALALARTELAALGEGRAAVIAPPTMVAALRAELGLTDATSNDLLDAPVTALTPLEAKGLEFDVVVVADPATIAGQNPRSLYVALTRATRVLAIVHDDPLPAPLA